jgi:hypothetical protein
MLEQEAQMFGLRDKVLTSIENRSPQQTQIREVISANLLYLDQMKLESLGTPEVRHLLSCRAVPLALTRFEDRSNAVSDSLPLLPWTDINKSEE